MEKLRDIVYLLKFFKRRKAMIEWIRRYEYGRGEVGGLRGIDLLP